MAIAAESVGYLHYYAGNYFGKNGVGDVDSFISAYTDVKTDILQSHKKTFSEKIREKIKTIEDDEKKQNDLIDAILDGSFLSSSMKMVNDSSNDFGTSASIAVDNIAFSTFGQLSTDALKKLINENGESLTNTVSKVKENMESALKKTGEYLVKLSGGDDTFLKSVKKDAKKFFYKNKTQSSLAKNIFQKSKAGFVSISDSDLDKRKKTIADGYLKMSREIAFLQKILDDGEIKIDTKAEAACNKAFKSYYKSKYDKIYNGPHLGPVELVAKIIGKFGGTMSHINGSLYELAICEMFYDTKLEISDKVYNITSDWIGSDYVDIDLDNRLVKDAVNNKQIPAKRKNKTDVMLTISKDGVSMDTSTDLGISAKKSNSTKKVKGKNGKERFGGEIKLEDSKNLFTLLKLATIYKSETYNMSNIYHIAAVQQEITEGDEKKVYSHGSLLNAWRSLVKSVVSLNFLDALSGVSSSGNMAAFLVINDEFYGIGSILDAILNNPRAVTIEGGQKRDVFYKLNTWEDDKTVDNTINKEKRSERVKEALTQKMNETLVTTKLNMGLLNL